MSSLQPVSALQEALEDQVVTRLPTGNGFRCCVCGLEMAGEPPMVQHLAGKQHRQAGARYAVANPRENLTSLRKFLNPIIIEAATSGVIQVDGGGYRCNYCNVSLGSVVPLADHLKSSSHKKHQETDSYDLQQAIEDGVISKGTSGVIFICSVCNVELSGQPSTMQHLDGKQHRETGAKYILANPWDNRASLRNLVKPMLIDAAQDGIVQVDATGFTCSLCKVTNSSLIPLEDHLNSNGHKNNCPKEGFVTFQHPDMRRFLEEGIVIQGDQHQKFRCCICQVDLTGETPTLQHLEGRQHREAGARYILAHPSDKRITLRGLLKPAALAAAEKEIIEVVAGGLRCTSCQVTLTGVAPLEEHLASNNHRKKIDTTAVNEIESAIAQLKIRPNIKPAPSSLKGTGCDKYSYSLLSEPRGLVYVFNYTFKGQPNQRNGAHLDSENIRATFKKLGYKVLVLEDLTKEETLVEFRKMRENPELNGVDSLLVFLLSHGADPYNFLTNDGEKMNLHSIRFSFSDRKCPFMRKKPKLFFANYCRDENMERGGAEDVDTPDDLVTIHAAAEGEQAVRCPDFGTVFVKSLCDVLESYAHTLDLRDLYIELREDMVHNMGTKPMWEDYGFKKFFFTSVR